VPARAQHSDSFRAIAPASFKRMLGGPTSTRQCPNRIDNNEVGTASGVDGAVHLDCLPYQSFSREPARSTRVVEREEIQFAFSQEHWLKASARMLLRAGGLCRIGHFVSKRTHRMDDGARHDDFGTSWMVVGHVRLGLDGAGYGRCDSCEQDGGPEHVEFSVSSWGRLTDRAQAAGDPPVGAV